MWAAWIVGLVALTLGPAEAQVSLTDGGAPVAEGDLLGFDGRYYRVLTELGEVTVDGRDLECEGPSCPRGESPLRISGEAYVIDAVMPPILETFARRNGYELSLEREENIRRFRFTREGADHSVILSATSSSEGIADLIADTSDLAISIRPPDEGETALLRQAGRGVPTRPGRNAILALDALVPVVSLGSDIDGLPFDALRRIASGRVAEWSRLGDDGPLTLHLPEEGSGVSEAIALQIPGLSHDNAVQHADLAELVETVEDSPGAIGLTLFSSLGGAEPVALTGPCGARSVATPTTVKTEDYPLALPIFFFAPDRRLGMFGRAVVDFATSPAAQPIIRRAGLIDQFPQSIPFTEQGERLALAILSAGDEIELPALREMMRDLIGLTRLSISFRFEDGQSSLDAQSTSNVALLAEAIERGVFDGSRLVFAGFSDGAGDADGNRRLSRERATAVRDAVAAAAASVKVPMEVAAYGEALPMACDGTEWGRRMNRRVEVWLD